jgi:hypothetical protein
MKKTQSRSNLRLSSIAIAVLLSLNTAANASGMFGGPLTKQPLPPVFKLSGSAGSIASGGLMGLIPLYGNADKALVYTNVAASYGTHNSYLLSPGLGARLIRGNQLFGAYLSGDYNHSNYASNFFIYNPGLEWMSTRWDVHLNGFIAQKNKNRINNLGFQSDSGNFSNVAYTGHGGIERELIQYDIAGNGVNAQLGYTLNVHGLKGRVYAGAYHYATSDVPAISGAQAGFDYLLTPHVSVGIAASHDNVYQTKGVFTISLLLGRHSIQAPTDIRERLTDFVPRHLGNLDTAAGLPTQRKNIANGDPKNLGNIWFFAPGNAGAVPLAPIVITTAQCTFENPCVGINQTIVNGISAISANAQLFMAQGDYSFSNSTALNLSSSQSMWGRVNGYTEAGSGVNRATILNAIQLSGNNTLDSLRITNSTVTVSPPIGSTPAVVGVFAANTATGQMVLNNLDINVASTTRAVNSIAMFGTNNPITLTNSTLNATGAIGAVAARFEGSGNVLVTGSRITTRNSTSGTTAGLQSSSATSRNITINGSIINAFDTGLGAVSSVIVGNSASLVLNNDTLSAVKSNSGANAGVNGLFVTTNATGSVVVNDSNITAETTLFNSSLLDVVGIRYQGSNTLTVNRSNLLATSNSTQFANGLVGFFAGSTITINGGTITAISNSAGGVGGGGSAVANGDGNLTINNGTLVGRVTSANGGSMNALFQDGTGTMTLQNNSSATVISNANVNDLTPIFLASGSAIIKNSTINSTANGNGQAVGVRLTNASNAIFTDSIINVTSNNGNNGALGVGLQDTANLSFTGTTINVFAGTKVSTGVTNTSANALNLTNVKLTVTGAINSVGTSGTINRNNVICRVNGVNC